MVVNRHHIKTPTEVVTTTLGIPEDYKQQCIQEAYKIGDKQGKQTNVKASMSSWYVWKDTSVYDVLLDKIEDEIQDNLYVIGDSKWKYNMTNAWTAIYKEGNFTIPHNHLPAQVSFVYYLKANVGESPLIFDECGLNINVHDDLLVVFPSYMSHGVMTHKGDDRICLAGNLTWVAR